MKLKTLLLSSALALSASLGVAAAQAAPAQDAPAKPFIIVIDPGHPSETAAGAEANGLSENRINWQVANRLAQRLAKMGITTYLTKRSENQKVTNRDRAEMANNVKASLLIRLHCDAGGGSGYSWYYPDRAGTKYGVTGPPKSVQIQSKRAAWVLNEAMKPVLQGYLKANSIKTDAATGVGGKQGGVLTGSIFAKVPTRFNRNGVHHQQTRRQIHRQRGGPGENVGSPGQRHSGVESADVGFLSSSLD